VWHALLRDSSFFETLLRFDEDLAEQARAAGCRRCGGVLHRADYPRKPRGGPGELGPPHERRRSLCCAREGCRRRTTPPSLRFLGRRVYFGAVVVLVSALVHGLSPRRAARLREQLGVDRRTLGRWRRWWQQGFAQSPFWQAARGRFVPPVERHALPAALLERFVAANAGERLRAALAFLAPLSTTS
jgi:hypothetical protein